MKFTESPLKGLYIIENKPFVDDRGMFFRTFCKKEFREVGHTKEFVQMNQSINNTKGTFRGLHYQLPPYKDIKLVRCITGKVLDIIVDIRKDSKTFLKSFLVELSEENLKMVYIPVGFAHGFITLKDNTRLVYMHSSYYEPNHEGAVNIKDTRLNIKLPIPINMISEFDRNIPFIPTTFEGI